MTILNHLVHALLRAHCARRLCRQGLAVAAMLTALLACSSIDEDHRYIAVDRQQQPADSDSTAVLPQQRRVLIEDFTGQRCVNCPNAANEIARLKAAYGADTIIAVSIHGGDLAVYSTDRLLGLRTALGDEYNRRWGVDAWPKGMVNRQQPPTTIDQWFTLVDNALRLTAPVAISATATLSDSTIAVSTTLEGLDSVDGSLQLWLTESAIVAQQMMPDGWANRTYEHNHVLRAAINGSWGEAVRLSPGQHVQLDRSIKADRLWNTANLSVVAFVYSASTGEVLQVRECPVTVAPAQ